MRKHIRNRLIFAIIACLSMIGLYIISIQPEYIHSGISGGALGGLVVAIYFLSTVYKSYYNDKYANELETRLADERMEKIEHMASSHAFVVMLCLMSITIFILIFLHQQNTATIFFISTGIALLVYFLFYIYYSKRY